MKFWVKILLLLIMSWAKLHAQFAALKFSTISVDQGLSNRVVTSIYQDKTGFIWAGTNDGLNRLDGYRIKTFFYQPNKAFNLPNNAIHQIIGKAKMWVSTESGIAFLNEKQSFQTIDDKGVLGKTYNANMFEDEKRIWICSKDSLYVYENKAIKNRPIKMPDTLVNAKQKAVKSFVNITKDAVGNYWGWKDDFLFKISLDEQKVLQVFTIKTHMHEGITFVKQDANHKEILWIGTWNNGLFLFNTTTQTSTLIGLDNLVIHNVTNYTDLYGNSWLVAATDKGFSLIHPKSFVTKAYDIGETFNLLVDKQNNLWMATAGGILYVEPQKQWFNTIRLSATIPALKIATQLFMPNTFSFIDGKYYAGIMYGKGVAVYNQDWQLDKYIPNLIASFKTSIYQNVYSGFSYKNNDWFCTDSGMVKCSKNGTVQKIVLPATVKNATRTNYFKIRKVVAINDSLMLVKSPFAIHVFNAQTEQFEKTFTHVNGNNQSLPEIYFSDIACIKSSCFITTDDGLLQLNIATGKWQWVKQNFANTRMQCIAAQDSLLWIGTQTGLSCFNSTNQQVKNYYRNDGLTSDNILNICSDSKKRVWLATTNGLTCFDKSNNHFTRIYKENGLPENLLEGLLFADASGKIYVGSIDAITWFYADKVLLKNQEIQATITEVFSNNQPIDWMQEQNEKYIKVAYTNNNISLHFALLNYNNTSLNKYYYLLEGADTAWHESQTGFLQFSNLKSGKYKLYVSSAAQKNIAMDVLYITIGFPFYQTWWFIALLVLMVAGIVFFIGRLKAKALREKLLLEKNYAQQIKDAEMQTLRSQMNPHFIFNTLNAINSFIIENKTEQASDYLVTFSKLVRNILENSRHENISLDKELTALQLYLQLEQVRLENSFSYSIEVDESIDSISLRVPPLIIQPFVENAIWHGLRNKHTHGNVWVAIKQENEHTIVITIADDGIGRDAASKLKANQINHKSYGIEITKTRIALLHAANKIEITDRMLNNEIEGTIVQLYLNTL